LTIAWRDGGTCECSGQKGVQALADCRHDRRAERVTSEVVGNSHSAGDRAGSAKAGNIALGDTSNRVDGGCSTGGPTYHRGRTSDERRDRCQSRRICRCTGVVSKIVGDRDGATDRVAPHRADVVALGDRDALGTRRANAPTDNRDT